MDRLLTWTRLTHRFLAERALYPMVCASALAVLLLFGRMYDTGTHAYRFMIWNLFLAWLPYAFAFAASALHSFRPRRPWLLLPFGALWLLFLPNAPYLVTDLVHLWRIPPALWWYDVGMVAAFGWAGCMLAVASLAMMQEIVRSYLGRVLGWLFALGSLGLCGFGVYLGRFVRLNSWDLFSDPRTVLSHFQAVLPPVIDRSAVGVSGLFAALLLVCYLAFQRPVLLRQHA